MCQYVILVGVNLVSVILESVSLPNVVTPPKIETLSNVKNNRF